MANEFSAKLSRQFHPLRFQRWAFSDLNPWLGWLAPAAQVVRAQRQPASRDSPAAAVESMVSEVISASLDYYRELRDALSEATFFQIYGNLFALYLADKHDAEARRQPSSRASFRSSRRRWPRSTKAATRRRSRASASCCAPGRAAAARAACSCAGSAEDYRDLLPDLPPDEVRRIRGEQEIIVRYEPEKAVETLPALLSKQATATGWSRWFVGCSPTSGTTIRADDRAAGNDREHRRDARRDAGARPRPCAGPEGGAQAGGQTGGQTGGQVHGQRAQPRMTPDCATET